MRLCRLLSIVLSFTCSYIFAGEPIQFARTPAISPDGKLIAFSFKGDIWTVSSEGGIARMVTMHEAHELYPIFSPDGKKLAFASKRHGGYDIYTVNVLGGRPTRLTFDSATDTPTSWSPDGKTILFASSRSPSYPKGYELYTIPANGGAVQRITPAEGRQGAFSPDGKSIAYMRGPGSWYRKGYRGSSNYEIWLCNAQGNKNQQLTRFEGNDASPMWSNDGQHLYYVSDVQGLAANVYRRSLDGNSKPILITSDKAGKPFHTEDGARHSNISADGQWIVYEAGADIYVVSTKPNSQPRRVLIEAYADDKSNSRRKVSYTSGATEFALSPRDEKHFAYVVHGEIFLHPVSSRGESVRLTNSPANDHGIAWAPNSSRLFFLSDRSGYEEIYRLEEDDPTTNTFTSAKKFKATRIPNTRGASGMMFAPNGSLVSFIRDGKLWTMKSDGTDQKVLVEEAQVIDYDWSPDAKWVVYSRMDGSFASELYIIPANGGKSRNITRYATWNTGVTWSKRRQKLAFLSRRPKEQRLQILSLQKPAVSGSTPPMAIDWEDIHHRVIQPAPIEAKECAISPDGSKVVFSAKLLGKQELWVVGSSGGSVVKLTGNNAQPRQITWARRLPNALFFRDGKGAIQLCRLPSGSSKTPTIAAIPYKAEMTIDDTKEFTEMFDQGWRYLADQFYDPTLHGVDWKKVREKYRPVVQHISMKDDLYALMYLMMGELNASHLGVSGSSTKPDESTAHLGIIFDREYRGRGLKIKQIVNRGPADKRGVDLKPGEYVLAIDGKTMTRKVNLSRLLNDRENDKIDLMVSSVAEANMDDLTRVRRVIIQPTSLKKVQSLLYDQWVENNAAKVENESDGKLGYIHIPSMNEAGLTRFVRALFSDNFKKEGIVLDVRFNGGGFTHEQVLDYLGSKGHTIFKHRFGGEGLVLRSYDRKWTKPLVLLINNRSYSDAEIFPNAFRARGLGKIVGVPTGGYVIGTSSAKLIDGSTFRLPRIGVHTVKGINMEKEGVRPDVHIENHPDQLAGDEDTQLKKAVEVLKEDVVAWKDKKKGVTETKSTSVDVP